MDFLPLHYQFLILISVSYIVLQSLKDGAKSEVSRGNQDKLVLRMPVHYLMLGGLFLIFAFYIVLMLILDRNDKKPEIWLELLVFNILIVSVLLFLGAYNVMSYFKHRVTLYDDILEISNWRGSTSKISSREVLSYRHREGERKFLIHTKDKTFKVHRHLVGLATLRNWLKREMDER